MSRARVLHVTLYLDVRDEAFRNQSDRMWNTLMALDFCILEELPKVGVVIGEYFGKDTKALECVPGVISLLAREPEVKLDVPKPQPAQRMHRKAA